MRNFALVLFGILAVVVICVMVVQDPVRKTSDPQTVGQNFIAYSLEGISDKAVALYDPANENAGYETVKAINSSIQAENVKFQNWQVSGTTATAVFCSVPPLQMKLTEQGGKWFVAGVGQAQ